MGSVSSFGFLFFLVLLAAAMIDHVASSGMDYNSKFSGAADQELSVAALNVRVSFKPYEEAWNSFKKTFGRQYRSEAEDRHRYQTFLENVQNIELHNLRFRNGNTTFWMGINQFTDMSLEEHRANIGRMAPANISESLGMLKCSSYVPPHFDCAASDTVDWRRKGYVTAVKNQEKCGSCWAFSATGALEGQHFRKTGRLVSLSEQQLVDCSGDFGNKGCNGGNEPDAYAYIYSAGGISSEIDYPYEAQVGKCRFSKSKAVATLKGCQLVKPGSEADLTSCVRTQGPVAVAVDASHDSFRFYSGGVYADPKCRKTETDLDHAVLTVGYGTISSKDYWIVKNSWGSQWGAQGYILIARSHGNMCGIATSASIPVV